MSYETSNTWSPAPCIIDTGIIVNKRDMRMLLADLGHVRYVHTQDGQQQSAGEGYVLEVFADRDRSTLVANHALYLNVYSFDYLELNSSPDQETFFDLIQDTRKLRLIPLSNPLQNQFSRSLDTSALDSVVTQVLSSDWDAQIEDEGDYSF